MTDPQPADKKAAPKEPPKPPPITATELEWLDSALGLDRFFAAWSPDGIQKLLPTFKLKAYPKGSEIVREGEVGSEMFVLYKGTVAVRRKRFLFGSKLVGHLKPGDFFGEVGFLVNAPRSATVVALEDAQAFSWGASDMHKVLEQNEEAARKLESVARDRIARLSGAEV